MKTKNIATFLAILAAALYAINIPLSKLLLQRIQPTMMAAFLYLGAGVGLFALGAAKKEKGEKLTKAELPYRNLNDTTPPSGGVALLFTFPPKKATI